MTATELVQTLKDRGVALTVAGDRIKYRAPAGVLTPELLAELAAQKPAVMRLLSSAIPDSPRVPRVTALRMASRKCGGCGNLTIASHGTACARCRREAAPWN